MGLSVSRRGAAAPCAALALVALAAGAQAAGIAAGAPRRSVLLAGLERVLQRRLGVRSLLGVERLVQEGGKLTGGGEAGDAGFGGSVALSADGTTALVGGDGDDENLGAAWVFTRSGSGWVEQGPKLSEPAATLFGASVALSADGSVALIGAPGTNTDTGAAWVFTRTGSRWRQQGRVLLGHGEVGGAWFGASVALSADGTTALVGGPDDAGSRGAAWVFTRTGGRWLEQGAKLAARGGNGFGTSVALSASGDTALVGGGAAWVFTRAASRWALQGRLVAHGAGGSFGASVALAADGDTALVGEPALSGRGAAWVYGRSGGRWGQGAELAPVGAADGGQFGASVALAAGGAEALVGAPLEDAAAGAAWLFARAGSSWAGSGAKLSASGESGAGELGASVAFSASGARAVLGAVFDDDSVGAVWVFANG